MRENQESNIYGLALIEQCWHVLRVMAFLTAFTTMKHEFLTETSMFTSECTCLCPMWGASSIYFKHVSFLRHEFPPMTCPALSHRTHVTRRYGLHRQQPLIISSLSLWTPALFLIWINRVSPSSAIISLVSWLLVSVWAAFIKAAAHSAWAHFCFRSSSLDWCDTHRSRFLTPGCSNTWSSERPT